MLARQVVSPDLLRCRSWKERSERARHARGNIMPVRGADGVKIRTLIANKCTANLPTNIVDFRGFDSSIILIQRGGILRPIGDLPESLSQAM